MESTYTQSRFDAFFAILEHLLKSSIKPPGGLLISDTFGGGGGGLIEMGDLFEKRGIFNLAKMMVSVLSGAPHGSL